MNWIERFLAAIQTHKADASAHHAKFDIFDKFREFIPWTSPDGFTRGGDSGYGVDFCGAFVDMYTGSTVDYDVYLWSGVWTNLLEAGKLITVEFIIYYLYATTDQNIWLRLGRTVGDPPSETSDHFGWKIIGADLYASNADGTAQAITDTAVDLVGNDQRTRLKIVLNPGTDCKFYVNDVLKVTHSINLPRTLYPSYQLDCHARTLTTLVKGMQLGRLLIEREN